MNLKRNLVVTTTPYRVSLFGGSTDIPEAYTILENGGAVVNFPINKYITTISVPRVDTRYRVGWSGKPQLVDRIGNIKHDLVRECLKIVGIVRGGLELTFTGHIPAGAGLGSSATVTVGTLHTLCEMVGKKITNEELASLSYIIERSILGGHCGKQDQYGCAIGGIKYIRFLPNEEVIVTQIKCSPKATERLQNSLYLYYTGIDRSISAEESLIRQTRRVRDNLPYLESLRDIAERGYKSLRKGDVDSVGKLLDENWKNKRKLGYVTSEKIDALYKIAKKCGAEGGKICGAGLGGAFIVFSNKPNFDELFTHKSVEIGLKMRRIPFKIYYMGSRVIHSE